MKPLLAVVFLLAAMAPAQVHYNIHIDARAALIDWEGKPALVLWGSATGGANFLAAVATFSAHAKSGCTWPVTEIGVRLVPQVLYAVDPRPCAVGRSLIWSENDDGHQYSGASIGAAGYYFGPASGDLLWWQTDCMYQSRWVLGYCGAPYCGSPDICASIIARPPTCSPEFWACVFKVELL